jgi:hypothetical protein
MEPRRKKLLAWALIGALALLALGSVVGSLALVLERKGKVVLRRVPSVVLRNWKDEHGLAIAIVNTDTTPGSFLLGSASGVEPTIESGEQRTCGFWLTEGSVPRGRETRVWVPARSIVLRSHSALVTKDSSVWLYGPNGSIGTLHDDYAWRAVPRATRFVAQWHPYYSQFEWEITMVPDEFYVGPFTRTEAVHVYQQRAVQRNHRDRGITGAEFYDWDGRRRSSSSSRATLPTTCRSSSRSRAGVAPSARATTSGPTRPT